MNAELKYNTDDDGNHLISVIGLRVLIACDRNGLFCAQGLDIDYATSGDSLEEAKENFVRGLCETAALHIEMFGDVKRLLRQAPQEVFDQFYAFAEGDVSVSRRMLSDDDICQPLLPGFLNSVEFIEQRTRD